MGMGLPLTLLLLCVACAPVHTATSSASSASSLAMSQGFPSTSASLYVFGASMVDTGENAVAMPLRSYADFDPYGSDYFGKPTGRYSNGRNMMDFITQELGFGFLSPYLKAFGSDFTHGVNFASSGSTAINSTAEGNSSVGLFCLLVQIDQFREYQTYVFSQQKEVSEKLRMQRHFSNSVYFIEAGSNDYKNGFHDADFDPVGLVLNVISAMKDALQALYDSGARTFIVMNLTPNGCTPAYLSDPFYMENWDEYGCKADYLQLESLHNKHLVELLSEFRLKFPTAEWVLYDAYSTMLDGFRNPSKYGIKYPFQACCGAGGTYNYNSEVLCGESQKYTNGTYLEATKCGNPSLHLIWDTIHPVESFYYYLAEGVLNGTNLSTAFNIRDRFKKRVAIT